jgi:YbbR domain-containing protein
VIVNRPADFVKIQVNGPRTLLSLLDPERLTVRLDLSGIGPGQASYKINPTMFNVPRQTSVTNVSPSEVILDVDRVVQRDIPVHVDVNGKPANGYNVTAVDAVPPTVMAIGPSRYVNTVAQIITEPLDISGANADVSRRVDLENPNPAVALTAMRVDAKAHVAEKISDREIRANVEVRDSDYKFHLDPNHATVTIRGPMLKLQGLDPNSLAYVDAKELTPGSHELPVQVDLPDGMQVVRQAPEKIKLRLYREKRSTSADEHTS